MLNLRFLTLALALIGAGGSTNVSAATWDFNGSSSGWSNISNGWDGNDGWALASNVSYSSGWNAALIGQQNSGSSGTEQNGALSQVYNQANGGYNSSGRAVFRNYEARLQPANAPGWDTGFYIYNRTTAASSWYEIDWEFLAGSGGGTSQAHTNIYKAANGYADGSVLNVSAPGGNFSSSYNTYKIRWSPTAIEWHINGGKVRSVSSSFSVSCSLNLNIWAPNYDATGGFAGSRGSSTTNFTSYCDWVNAWNG